MLPVRRLASCAVLLLVVFFAQGSSCKKSSTEPTNVSAVRVTNQLTAACTSVKIDWTGNGGGTQTSNSTLQVTTNPTAPADQQPNTSFPHVPVGTFTVTCFSGANPIGGATGRVDSAGNIVDVVLR